MQEINKDSETNTPLQTNFHNIGLFVADTVDAMLAYWDKDQICRYANYA